MTKVTQLINGIPVQVDATSGSTIIKEQASHGFTLLDGIYHDGTSWVKAKADLADTVAVYCISEVTDANNFQATKFGAIEAPSHGFTVGEYYFLSSATAGTPDIDPPTLGFSSPLFYVEDINTVHMTVHRATDITDTAVVGKADINLSNIESTTIPANLNPDVTNTKSVGETSKRWGGVVSAQVDSDNYVITEGAGTDKGNLHHNPANEIELSSSAATTPVRIKATSKVILDGTEVDVNTSKIINVVDGVNAQDAITKNQLDGVITNVGINTGNVTNLETLSGVAGGINNGTFTGDIIPDNQGTKAALQSLETYSQGTSNPNILYNGNFDIWQRGTVFTGQQYTADRWLTAHAGHGHVTRQAGTTIGSRYKMRVQRNTGSTSTGRIHMNQTLESADCIPLQGKQVTLSFEIRMGSGFSSAAMAVGVNLGTGIDLGALSGWAPATPSDFFMYPTKNTSWTTQTMTFTMPTNANQLRLWFYNDPTGTANTVDYFEIAKVKLELSPVATPFIARPIPEELALCQRYHERIEVVNNSYSAQLSGITFYGHPLSMQVTKRVSPSLSMIHVNSSFYWVRVGAIPYSSNDTTGTVLVATSSTIRLYQGANSVTGVSGNIYVLEAGVMFIADAEM